MTWLPWCFAIGVTLASLFLITYQAFFALVLWLWRKAGRIP